MVKKLVVHSLLLIALLVGSLYFNTKTIAVTPTQYQVVFNRSDIFNQKIESLLQKDWKLQGGVSLHTARTNTGVWYAQALYLKQ